MWFSCSNLWGSMTTKLQEVRVVAAFSLCVICLLVMCAYVYHWRTEAHGPNVVVLSGSAMWWGKEKGKITFLKAILRIQWTSSNVTLRFIILMDMDNAPAAFQRSMEEILPLLGWRPVLYSKIMSSHWDVCRGLSSATVPTKCKLFRKEVRYVERLVSADRVQINPKGHWSHPGLEG